MANSDHLFNMQCLRELPDDEWLTRLRHKHFVWDCKQHWPATVEFAYEPPEPGSWCGSIGIAPIWEFGGQWGIGHPERWWIQPNGKGLDHSQLLWPLEGNMPDEVQPISEAWHRQLMRTIGSLQHRVEQLEASAHTHTREW